MRSETVRPVLPQLSRRRQSRTGDASLRRSVGGQEGELYFSALALQDIIGREDGVFGPSDWERYFGVKVPLDLIVKARIDLKALLIAPYPFFPNISVGQAAFLFYGLPSFKGRPLNMKRWQEIFPGLSIDCGSGRFLSEVCGLGWHLIPRGVPLIDDLSLQDQEASLGEKGLLPASAIEAVTGLILSLQKQPQQPYATLAGRTVSRCNRNLVAVTDCGRGQIRLEAVDSAAQSDLGLCAKWF